MPDFLNFIIFSKRTMYHSFILEILKIHSNFIQILSFMKNPGKYYNYYIISIYAVNNRKLAKTNLIL